MGEKLTQKELFDVIVNNLGVIDTMCNEHGDIVNNVFAELEDDCFEILEVEMLDSLVGIRQAIREVAAFIRSEQPSGLILGRNGEPL